MGVSIRLTSDDNQVIIYGMDASGTVTRVIQHIRKPMPRRGGNSFYRDRRDFSSYAATLCGAPVTSLDIGFREAGFKTMAQWFKAQTDRELCAACQRERASHEG
jgi:hypothetical protein